MQARTGGGKRPPGVPPPNDGVLGVAWSGCAVIGVEWILDEKMVQLFIFCVCVCVICNIIYYIW